MAVYSVVKRNKRLWIKCDGVPIYTPPGFVRRHLASRNRMRALADEFNKRQSRDILAIIDFEQSPRKIPLTTPAN